MAGKATQKASDGVQRYALDAVAPGVGTALNKTGIRLPWKKIALWSAAPTIAMLFLVTTLMLALLGPTIGQETDAAVTVQYGRDVAGIPARALDVYFEAADETGVPWQIIAAVGKTQTNHGDPTGERFGFNGEPAEVKRTTTCAAIGHVGDHLSAVVPDVARQQYLDAGAQLAIVDASYGRAATSGVDGVSSAVAAISDVRGQLSGVEPICWVIDIGVEVVATVDAEEHSDEIASVMDAIDGDRMVWVEGGTSKVDGPYDQFAVAAFFDAVDDAQGDYDNLNISGWLPSGFLDGFTINDGAATDRHQRIANDLTIRWPAPPPSATEPGGGLPPIEEEQNGVVYSGPFLLDTDALIEIDDRYAEDDFDPQSLADSSRAIGRLIRTSITNENPDWVGPINSDWLDDQELWKAAVAELPIKPGFYQAPPPAPERTCIERPTVVIGDRVALRAQDQRNEQVPGLRWRVDRPTMTFAAALDRLATVPAGERAIVAIGNYPLGPLPQPDFAGNDPTVEDDNAEAEQAEEPPSYASLLDTVINDFGTDRLAFVVPRNPGLEFYPSAATNPALLWATELEAARARHPNLHLIDATDWVPEAGLGQDPATTNVFVVDQGGDQEAADGGFEQLFDTDGTAPTPNASIYLFNWLIPQVCDLIQGETPEAVEIPVATVADRIIALAGAYTRREILADAVVCVGGGGGISLPANINDIYTKYAQYNGNVTTPNPVPKTTWQTLEPQIVTALDAAQQAGFAGEELIVIVAIAGRESRYDPSVLNPDASTGDLSYGLWQINTIDEGVWNNMRQALGLNARDDLYDPYNTARAARYLFEAISSTPFHAWGPYKGEPPLFGHGSGPGGQAADWVEAAYAVAVQYGYVGPNGEPVAAQTASSAIINTVTGCLPGGGITTLEGPDCDGLAGTGATYLGKVNGTLSITDLEQSPWGPLQPAAAAGWRQVMENGVSAGFTENDFDAWSGGPGSRKGGSSNHTIGLAIDINQLAWTPTRSVPGERLPVAFAFDEPFYQWLRGNAWRWGWCNPRWARPFYLNGTSVGGADAAGNGNHLEQWHWEFVGGSDHYQGTQFGDLNGPNGVPD